MTRSPTFRTTTTGPITNRKLGTDRLLNFAIPLPPREEQEAIVELDRNLRQQSEEFARFADQARAALAEVMPA
jgi:restriction endonuclease S subunit